MRLKINKWLVRLLIMAFVATGLSGLASCGTVRTHVGVDHEYDFDGNYYKHKHPKYKKYKHKKHKHHHHHDD